MDKVEEKATTPKKPRKKRRVDPLKKKSKKPQIIKNLDEINKLSKGTELIQKLQNEPKIKDVSIYVPQLKIEEKTLDKPEDIKIDYDKLIKDGVEVVDVKAIPKNPGIPIKPGEHKNFDKI